MPQTHRVHHHALHCRQIRASPRISHKTHRTRRTAPGASPGRIAHHITTHHDASRRITTYRLYARLDLQAAQQCYRTGIPHVAGLAAPTLHIPSQHHYTLPDTRVQTSYYRCRTERLCYVEQRQQTKAGRVRVGRHGDNKSVESPRIVTCHACSYQKMKARSAMPLCPAPSYKAALVVVSGLSGP